jgi:hypothetical protein
VGDRDGNWFKVRVLFRQDGVMHEHAQARACADDLDAGIVLHDCVDAVFDNPLLVLCHAVLTATEMVDAPKGYERANLLQALYIAATGYTEHHTPPAKIREG